MEWALDQIQNNPMLHVSAAIVICGVWEYGKWARAWWQIRRADKERQKWLRASRTALGRS